MKSAIPARLVTFACAALGLLAGISSGRATAAPGHPLKPLLWKVEGKDLTKPSYLFGTIHIGKGPVATLHPAAKKAFDECATFHAEIAMDSASQLASMPLMMRSDGKKLSASIGKDLSAQLDAELERIKPGLDATPFQPMKTWFVAMLPQLLPGQLAGEKPLDLLLWEKATTSGKKTAGLEKAEDQLRGFNELSEAEQITFLSETLKLLKTERAEGKDTVQQLVAAYVSGEPTKVVEEMDRAILEMAKGENKELGTKLLKRLLTDRDKTMAESIITTLKSDPGISHFFAAGAGHFCAEKSIRSHLQEAGYTVTRIEK